MYVLNAELRLVVTRDEITNIVKNCDSPAFTVLMEYDADAGTTNVNLFVYRKTGGTGTYGDLLYSTAGEAFSTNPLQLQVTADSLSLVYNGATLFTTNSHGLDLGEWTGGAVCAIEAEDRDNTEFVRMDNFKAWRPDAQVNAAYENTFTNVPDGMMLRALPEDISVRRYWSSDRFTETYVTNGSTLLIPQEDTWGGTWMNPRRDYQNGARYALGATNVVEVRAAYSDFTEGIAKICIMPDELPEEIYNKFVGQALYVECVRNGADIEFIAYRHDGVNGNRDARGGSTNTYVASRSISLQADANTMKVYYGSELVIDTAHALTNFVVVYENGAYPHYEFQNDQSSTHAYQFFEEAVCRVLPDFLAPQE